MYNVSNNTSLSFYEQDIHFLLLYTFKMFATKKLTYLVRCTLLILITAHIVIRR